MTDERDFDRLARAWLALSPDRAPERSVTAVLQAVETTPQVRRWSRWLPGRNIQMSRLPLVATAAVVGVVAIGGLMFIGSRNPAVTVVPSASPSPSASASASGSIPPSGAEIPPALRYRWIGAPRDIGRGETSRSSLNLTKDSYFFAGTNVATDLQSTLLGSLASSTGPDEITIVTPNATDALCAEGDTGVYRYALAPGETQMTVTEVSEDCAARSIAVTGDWYRSACKDTLDGCWGEMAAGTYPSQYIDPRLDPGEIWHVPFGAMTYTVPDGWATSSDYPDSLHLTPVADYALETAEGPPEGTWHHIIVNTQPAATAQNDACTPDQQADVERTPAGLIDWVTSHPGVVATEPQPVTIDGHSGLAIDIRLADDWTGTCPDAGRRLAIFLTQDSKPDGWSWGVDELERQRLIFLDIGDGDIVLIGIDTTDADRFEALAAEAMPIIESFRFK